MRKYLTMFTLAAVIALCASAAPAVGEKPNIQQLLDRPISLTVADMPIGDVFKRLSEQSGIPFQVSDETLECLPYGDQTRLDVRLKDITLRKALTPMLRPQALTWTVEADGIHIVPTDPLYRIGRRATYDEMVLLGKLLTDKFTEPLAGEKTIEQIRTLTGDAKLQLSFHAKIDQGKAYARAAAMRPTTPAEWLDGLCHGSDCTWYLSGNTIIVLGKADQVRRQLQRPVSFTYKNADLTDVLLDLSRRSQIKLLMEPGVLTLLPESASGGLNLSMSNATVAQALEVISGATGLTFTPVDEGVKVTASESLLQKNGSRPTRQRSPFFVKFSMPGPNGSAVEVYLRADDLPEEVQKQILAEKEKFIEQLKAQAAAAKPANE